MSYKNKLIAFIIFIVVLGFGSRYLFYKYLNAKDKSDRPWAYKNENGHSFTGKWKGSVKDADGFIHDIVIELFSPYDDEYRKNRASSKRIKRDRSSKNYFEGTAVETYKNKVINHEVYGNFISQEENTFTINIRTEDKDRYEGFNINLGSGIWKDDNINIDMSFAYFTKELYSTSDSADPRYDYIGKLDLVNEK